MKIILAGTTGFVGQEVLSQCLAHPSITSIIALSRRDLTNPSSNTNINNHRKLQVHHMQEEDFLSYSDPKLKALFRGADACIWTLGVTPSRASDDGQAFRRVTVEYTSKAAQAFDDAFVSSPSSSAILSWKGDIMVAMGIWASCANGPKRVPLGIELSEVVSHVGPEVTNVAAGYRICASDEPDMLLDKVNTDKLAYEVGHCTFRLMMNPEEDIVLSMIGIDSLMAIELHRWWKQTFKLASVFWKL